MSDETAGKVHWSFWVISVVALIWNLLGVMNFIGQLNAEGVAAMPESHRALIEGRPAWATGAFAIAVFAGALGCLLLLLRKSAAFYLFIVSLLGVLAQLIPTLRMITSTVEVSPAEIVAAIVLPVVIAVFLIWYAKRATSKGWLR